MENQRDVKLSYCFSQLEEKTARTLLVFYFDISTLSKKRIEHSAISKSSSSILKVHESRAIEVHKIPPRFSAASSQKEQIIEKVPFLFYVMV